MNEQLQFKTRADFRNWLAENCLSSEGVWLLFGKSDKVQTLKPDEALEEALCFGWIDGVMKKIDDDSYIKYFALRRKVSKWSAKNKALIEKLEKAGLITDLGRTKIDEAKANGQWENSDKSYVVSDNQTEELAELLKINRIAYDNFLAMPPSVKKTYTRAYFDAKTEEGRDKRLAWIISRTEKNLRPM